MSRYAALTFVTVVALLVVAPLQAAPTTVVRTKHPIAKVAHDGGRIAWITSRPGGDVNGEVVCIEVRAADLSGARRIGLHARCGVMGAPYHLALAGARALWTEDEGGGSNEQLELYTASSYLPRRARRVGDFFYHGNFGGEYLHLAGDRRTLAYAWATTGIPTEEEFDLCDKEGGPCRYRLLGGGAARVGAGSVPQRIPHVPPAALFAASVGRIAVVPAAEPLVNVPKPHIAPGTAVEIRTAGDGALLSSFAPGGTVRAVALDGATAAVLVRDAAGKRIERYDALRGVLLDATPVPPATAPAIDADGSLVAFRVDRSIRVLDAVRRRIRHVWTARRAPVGVSLEGTRLVWAVNGTRGGRIQTAPAPR